MAKSNGKLEFVVRQKSSRGNGKVILSGEGSSKAVSTLQIARQKLGDLVKSGKLKAGTLRCAVFKNGEKKDEWTISANAKNASKSSVVKKSTKKAS